MKSKLSFIFLLFLIGGCLSQTSDLSSQCFSNKGPQLDIPRRSFQWPRPSSGFVPVDPINGLLITHDVEWTLEPATLPIVAVAKTELVAELTSINYGTCVPTNKVSGIAVKVKNKDAVLSLTVDESYKLTLKDKAIIIEAETQFGARHGITTLQNMLELRSCNEHVKFANTALGGKQGYYYLPFVNFEITDAPRLHHRGLMLDTSRAFQPVNTMKRILLTMSRVKMSVLHWHATDDQSFPLIMPNSAKTIHGTAGVDCYKDDTNPCLGAYSNEKTYNLAQIDEIIKFANNHGIRVIIEVDMPSHARSWASKDTSLVECYGVEHQTDKVCAEQVCGPLALNLKYNPVLDLAKAIIDDLDDLVPKGELIHLGMDEVYAGCWGEKRKNELMMQWLDDVTKYAATKKRRIIVWQDVVGEHEGVEQPAVVKGEKVIPQVWKEPEQGLTLLERGLDLIWSNYNGMYLDCGRGNTAAAPLSSWCNPFKTWWDVYLESPDLLYPNHKSQVLGGEVCLWAEQVNELNIETVIWPRAAAWAGASWESRDHVPFSTGNYEDDMLEPQEHLKRFSFAMFRNCVPFTPMQTMWCYYGDTVGGGANAREYCDQYSSQYLKAGPATPAPPTTAPPSTDEASTDKEGECCPCSGAKALSILTFIVAVVIALIS